MAASTKVASEKIVKSIIPGRWHRASLEAKLRKVIKGEPEEYRDELITQLKNERGEIYKIEGELIWVRGTYMDPRKKKRLRTSLVKLLKKYSLDVKNVDKTIAAFTGQEGEGSFWNGPICEG